MNFDQLRVFLVVAAELHFTRAAEQLHLTQPTVSASIAGLETHFGVRLFHRIGRQVELTDAGNLLVAQARTILAQVAAGELALRELTGLERGRLAVGASLTVASYWLPRYLHRFAQSYPGIQIAVQVGNSTQVAKKVVDGEVELAIVEAQTDGFTALDSQVVGQDELVLVVGKGHQWWERESVSFSELPESMWIMREAGSGTRQDFENAIKAKGIQPEGLRIVLELPGGEMVKAAVESGAGAAVLSRLLIDRELQLGTLRSPQGICLPRQFRLLSHRERYCSRAAQVFAVLIGR